MSGAFRFRRERRALRRQCCSVRDRVRACTHDRDITMHVRLLLTACACAMLLAPTTPARLRRQLPDEDALQPLQVSAVPLHAATSRSIPSEVAFSIPVGAR